MIEQMKKVSIVLLNKEKETALKSLRKIGLVHLEKVEGSSEKLNAFKESTNNAIISESILSEIKIAKQKSIVIEDLTKEQVSNLCAEIVNKSERKKQLLEEISSDATELERFAKWGSVLIEDFDYLKSKDIQLKLYEISADKYATIDESIQTILVNNDKKTVRFLILNGGETRPEKLLPEAFEVPFPRMSTNQLEKEIENDNLEINEIDKFFENNAKYLPNIKKFKKQLESDIEFENVNAGMAHENEKSETDLAWISGYVPTANIEEFSAKCKENQWAFAISDPEDDDIEVPTKLKNNKFVSLIYPLSDFLGTVPGYHEYDISSWFLIFFAIFFGMIFGDGGYGILLTVVVLALMLKNKLSGKKNPPLMPLGLILGIATMIWGTVTCTWFGLTPEQLPDWIKAISIPAISSAYPKGPGELSTDQNLQIFCFSLALIQLTVAHVKGMARNRKSLKFFGELGSMLQLWGMFYVVLSLVVSSEFFAIGKVVYGIPIGLVSIGCIAVGFILSFIFANYEGSVLASVLESCKGIITVLLGVVNIFSDIISYIRLWAVGLAGAAISNTVNTMAGPLFGHALLFVFALLLCVGGHGLNMILNLLSVIVHGVRLNTLEFSSHLGMSWSGIKYAPFAESESK
jgi:V/A-type H+-transporting ATPase subunit I